MLVAQVSGSGTAAISVVPPLRVMALLRVREPLLPTEMVWLPELMVIVPALELEEAV